MAEEKVMWPWKGFSRWEFSCKCGCGFNTVDAELMMILVDLKEYFDWAKIIITSGCRCEKHNAAVDGRDDSQHKLGRAADVQVSGVKPIEVYGYLVSRHLNKYGFGKYNTFVHIDSRDVGVWR